MNLRLFWLVLRFLALITANDYEYGEYQENRNVVRPTQDITAKMNLSNPLNIAYDNYPICMFICCNKTNKNAIF